MATESKANVVKVKPPSHDVSKGKAVFPINKKKIESSSSKPPLDSKNKSVTTVSKSVVKENGLTSTSKTTNTTTVKVKQKKVYTLAGQKYDPPDEREPLRIFYESLSKQVPSSEMAEFWMMEHGLLSLERAKRAYERKQRRQQQLRMGTPIKSPLKPYKPKSSQSQKQQVSKSIDVKAKKRVIDDSDDDDDFIAKRKKIKRLPEMQWCWGRPLTLLTSAMSKDSQSIVRNLSSVIYHCVVGHL